nr:DUF1127 domain-containing protein [uncultured Pseudomonas sp.]
MDLINVRWICILMCYARHPVFLSSHDQEANTMKGISEVSPTSAIQPAALDKHGAQPRLTRVQRLLRRWRTRQALLTLTEAELRDVGLSLQQAQAEAAKPFWKG